MCCISVIMHTYDYCDKLQIIAEVNTCLVHIMWVWSTTRIIYDMDAGPV